MKLIENMSDNKFLFKYMRLIHRYLGFFLVGIMTVYALSGVVLIFRDSDTFKIEKQITKEIEKGKKVDEIGELLRIRRIEILKEEEDKIYFKEGVYDSKTGIADYKVKTLPFVLDKMAHLHKAKSGDPLYFLNIFFGISLLFFSVSSFWMYVPKSKVFKKGMYFVAGGIVLTLALLLI